MRTRRLIFVIAIIMLLAIFAHRWLPAFLHLLSINGDLIQSLDSSISIISSIVIVISSISAYILMIDKKEDVATLDQRNRHILLTHMENFWVKGVLEKSLHGAALLELGIHKNADAVATYPWTIKKDSANDILPVGISMLDIFHGIGMGRALLILGAPGSGKTTMLLELARQLITRARNNATEPIPIIFNLFSWTTKQSLEEWLAAELNVLYNVPRAIAPTWVKENKLLLLLDGLDEVKHENRDKCIEAINQFRSEYGLTCMAVCSRSQEYAELKSRLTFDGAIEIQPLTQKQIASYFTRFGKKLAGLKQVLKKDGALREMIESPLFLSIMILAYQDTQSVDILVSKNEIEQRKYLFDAYITRMFEHRRAKNVRFEKRDTLNRLSWLARKMIEHQQIPYLFENMQPDWLDKKNLKILYTLSLALIGGLVGALDGLLGGTVFFVTTRGWGNGLIYGKTYGWLFGLAGGLLFGLVIGLTKIETVDRVNWSWKGVREIRKGEVVFMFALGLAFGLVLGYLNTRNLVFAVDVGLIAGLNVILIAILVYGLTPQVIEQTTNAGQKIKFSFTNATFVFLIVGLLFAVTLSPLWAMMTRLNDAYRWSNALLYGLAMGQAMGAILGLFYGGMAVLQHFVLRILLSSSNYLPWNIIPFLDYCDSLIFLRRVGGGYIFIHRLIMKHFADMIN